MSASAGIVNVCPGKNNLIDNKIPYQVQKKARVQDFIQGGGGFLDSEKHSIFGVVILSPTPKKQEEGGGWKGLPVEVCLCTPPPCCKEYKHNSDHGFMIQI